MPAQLYIQRGDKQSRISLGPPGRGPGNLVMHLVRMGSARVCKQKVCKPWAANCSNVFLGTTSSPAAYIQIYIYIYTSWMARIVNGFIYTGFVLFDI